LNSFPYSQIKYGSGICRDEGASVPEHGNSLWCSHLVPIVGVVILEELNLSGGGSEGLINYVPAEFFHACGHGVCS